MRSIPRRPFRTRCLLLSACIASLLAIWPDASQAQDKPSSAVARGGNLGTAPSRPGTGPVWAELSATEQQALAPLRNQWVSIDELGKRKWLQIAARYPTMSEADQARLQERMVEWTRLTPQERSKVRLQFLEAKKIPTTKRQADWEAYQALTPEERKTLAARAASAARPASAPRPARKAEPAPNVASGKRKAQPQGGVAAHPSAAAAPATPATPSVVQAAPGATTVLITKRQSTPPRPAASSARIAVSADVVDKETLLPRAGAQSPYGRAAQASTPAPRR